ncbi:hypothetical protein [Cupriavidus sp. DL-D2]|uniref:hypothetical protein n=1 Tax=Cupriavidus sp. DL-D2 TaxID=3144974 RepID=UPI0032127FDF
MPIDTQPTLLTYCLPIPTEGPLEMREQLFRHSVREYTQSELLTSWETKDGVIRRVLLTLQEEGKICFDLVAQARQHLVEKGMRIRDIAAQQAHVTGGANVGHEGVHTVQGGWGTGGRKDHDHGESVYHPPRTTLVVSPKYMHVERCFQALDGYLGTPIAHNRLVEFNENGEVVREVPGGMVQITTLVVSFPESFTLSALLKAIRLQLRRKVHELVQHGKVIVPDLILGSPSVVNPQLIREHLFKYAVTTLILIGFSKRHARLAESQYAPGLWGFLRELVTDGIHVVLSATPAVMDIYDQDDVRQMFPCGPHSITAIRPEDASTSMLYYWGLLGVEEPMQDEFVEFAYRGGFQRGLIEPQVLDFNRRVNLQGQPWREALQKSGKLTGDMKNLGVVFENVLQGKAITLAEATKYRDELPLGVKITGQLDMRRQS